MGQSSSEGWPHKAGHHQGVTTRPSLTVTKEERPEKKRSVFPALNASQTQTQEPHQGSRDVRRGLNQTGGANSFGGYPTSDSTGPITNLKDLRPSVEWAQRGPAG